MKKSGPRSDEFKVPANTLAEEMTLQELREAFHIPQSELGRKLGIKQAAVSRKDIRLGHLKKTIEAMGVELRVIAHFQKMDICLAA